MPAQYPGMGYVADSQTVLLRKLVNNTALLAAAIPAGTPASVVAVPATSGAAGTVGEFAVDGDYLYVVVAANTWRRTAINDW